ncbi:nucleotidyltransferase family protein [Sphingomonas donggukensis]|uniref:Nucleotidyltransferase family protein n=1 Tax=Sphingomonas donggukensis TaxID=2949093 RepID=A0ABY4TX46_9SPHN|nr:nucleotidyltransferase family protein [Sphingomonas donggukensis]URW76973.1 nucleotidyltransferase family protein [Sphingomonas donggukensis]
MTLVRALRDPASTAALDGDGWTALIAMARAEQMAGTLARRVTGIAKPPAADCLLTATLASAEQGRIAALWEAEAAHRVLALLGVPVVLLKGTAYVAAGLQAGQGRSIGDLDILVPRASLDAVEAALLAAGWEWVKPDPYDDAYYRHWMHELPPLIHRERDRMIDVHHTILPLTARITPDIDAMIDDSVTLGNGLRVLSREDMVLHSVAHLFADGDLAGGLRNLWDIHCLLKEVETSALMARARHHGLEREAARAMRLAQALYSPSEVEKPVSPLTLADRLYRRRLLARDGWGRATRPLTRLAFYIRSHWLRMPPLMLARHLWTKWRKAGPA